MRITVGVIVILFFLIACFPVMAQPCGTPGLPPCDPGDPVPITGIEFLIGLGVLFGVKKIRQNKSSR